MATFTFPWHKAAQPPANDDGAPCPAGLKETPNKRRVNYKAKRKARLHRKRISNKKRRR